MKKSSQKYDWGDPAGSIAYMAFSIVPEKQNNKFESIIKTNKGESVHPAGDISEMVAAVTLKK